MRQHALLFIARGAANKSPRRFGASLNSARYASSLSESSSGSSSESSTATWSDSIKGCTGAALVARGLYFNALESFHRQKRPVSIDFHGEWQEFIGAVKDLTGLPSAHHDGANEALSRFLLVISQVYGKENDFKISLLIALRESLGGFCEETRIYRSETSSATKQLSKSRGVDMPPMSEVTGVASNATRLMASRFTTGEGLEEQKACSQPKERAPIRLKGCDVGFSELSQFQDLNLLCDYGIATSSKHHLATVVFGQDVFDVTATVELKLSSSTCVKLDPYGPDPDLTSTHASLGQALSHAFDVWYCLARRGVKAGTPYQSSVSLPAVVLAASKQAEVDETLLCCTEAYLEIPEHLGGVFSYRIERSVSFPSQNRGSEAAEAYTEAIAVFIRTLRIGLANAKAILENKESNEDAVSLCCSPPREDLYLLASPVPFAKPSTRGFTITQGELYKFAGVDVSLEKWIRGIGESHVLLFDSSSPNLEDCIVKVSCSTVHRSLVSPETSWNALLRVESAGTVGLKNEIAKVLLACAFVSRRCLITVMMDLSRPDDDTERVLSFQENSGASPCNGLDSPPVRWEAFSNLVRNVLMPLASIGVVHTDIRFDPEQWSLRNIVVDQRDGSMEFRMIDFESLVILDHALTAPQPYAISVNHLCRASTAHDFVFWQVLWVAYVWCPTTRSDNLVNAKTFVFNYLKIDEGEFDHFNHWIEGTLSDHLGRLVANRNNVKDDGVIKDTLEIFRAAFSSESIERFGRD
jgi:hypothetical protein